MRFRIDLIPGAVKAVRRFDGNIVTVVYKQAKRISEKSQRFLHSPPTPPIWGTSEPGSLSKSPRTGDLGGGSGSNLGFPNIL
jgi:hypothetical protein